MKITPKYGSRVLTLPAEDLLKMLPNLDKKELAVLIYAMANPDCTEDGFEEGTGLTKEEIKGALDFWKKVGVITYSSKASAKETKSTEKKTLTEDSGKKNTVTGGDSKQKVVILTGDLPSYTTAEINRILEKNRGTKALIDSCNQILGRILKIHEIEVIIKLYDSLQLDTDYILLLCSHCVQMGKTTMRYIEKTAVNLYDAGITEYSMLEKHIENLNAARQIENEIKKLFGLGERTLTKKEQDFILSWTVWGFSLDIIKKAYEINADSGKRVSLNYVNGILDNWHKHGYTTVEEIEAAEAEFKKANSKDNTDSNSTFDIDEFYEAALKRSYERR